MTLSPARTALPRDWWACPACHRVCPRLNEVAELSAGGERRHILCDSCFAQLRASEPLSVLDWIRELAA